MRLRTSFRSYLRGSFLVLPLVLTSCSSTPLKKPFTLSDAVQVADSDHYTASFHFEMNKKVFNEVQRRLATSDSRKQLQQALTRMNHLRSQIEAVFKAEKIPVELVAVPLEQSDYTNLKTERYEGGLGIWRFTPATANLYDLITREDPTIPLNAESDERLDITKATQAVANYFKHLNELFHDWRFSLLAYSRGESWVQSALDKNSELTPWQVEAASPNDIPCLTETMALLFISRHPELLEN